MASNEAKGKSEALVKAEAALRETGHAFNSKGELRQIDPATGDILPDAGFVFEVKKGDHAHNQTRYEAIGEIMTDYVYGLLDSDPVCLKKMDLQSEDSKNSTLKSFIYASEDWECCKKLCLLIHGSGVVRAGQWARRLIMNDNLDVGTQIPYIMKLKSLGYGILVLNTNDNVSCFC